MSGKSQMIGNPYCFLIILVIMSGKTRSLSQTPFCFMRGKTRAEQFEDRDKYDRPSIPNIPDSINLSFYMFGMIPAIAEIWEPAGK